MVDSVFVVVEQGPEPVGEVLARAFTRELGHVEVAPGTFEDRIHPGPPVVVTVRGFRFGSVVEVGGAELHVAQRVQGSLGGIAAAPPISHRVTPPIEAGSPHPAPSSVGDDADSTTRGARRSPVLRFDDGSVVDLAGQLLFGRNPVAKRDQDRDAQRVEVDDPELAVSKTHFALRVRGADVWVEDLASTNGTVIVAPDGSVTTLVPGEPVALAPGCSIRFGSLSATLEER